MATVSESLAYIEQDDGSDVENQDDIKERNEQLAADLDDYNIDIFDPDDTDSDESLDDSHCVVNTVSSAYPNQFVHNIQPAEISYGDQSESQYAQNGALPPRSPFDDQSQYIQNMQMGVGPYGDKSLYVQNIQKDESYNEPSVNQYTQNIQMGDRLYDDQSHYTQNIQMDSLCGEQNVSQYTQNIQTNERRYGDQCDSEYTQNVQMDKGQYGDQNDSLSYKFPKSHLSSHSSSSADKYAVGNLSAPGKSEDPQMSPNSDTSPDTHSASIYANSNQFNMTTNSAFEDIPNSPVIEQNSYVPSNDNSKRRTAISPTIVSQSEKPKQDENVCESYDNILSQSFSSLPKEKPLSAKNLSVMQRNSLVKGNGSSSTTSALSRISVSKELCISSTTSIENFKPCPQTSKVLNSSYSGESKHESNEGTQSCTPESQFQESQWRSEIDEKMQSFEEQMVELKNHYVSEVETRDKIINDQSLLLHQLKEEIQNFRNDIKSFAVDKDSLKEDFVSLKSKVEESENKSKKNRSDIESLDEVTKVCAEKMRDLQANDNSLKKYIIALQSAFKKLNENSKKTLQADQQNQCVKFSEEYDEMIKKLGEFNNVLKNEIATLQSRMDENEKEVMKISSVESTLKHLQKYEEKIKKLEANNNGLVQQITFLRSKWKENELVNMKKDSELEYTNIGNQHFKEYEEKFNNLNASTSDLKDAVATLQARLEMYELGNKNKQTDLEVMVKEHEYFKEYVDSIKNKQTDLEVMVKEHESFKEYVESIKNKQTDLEVMVKEHESFKEYVDRINSCHASNAVLKEVVSSFQRKLTELESGTKTMKDDITKLLTSCTTSEKQLNDSHDSLKQQNKSKSRENAEESLTKYQFSQQIPNPIVETAFYEQYVETVNQETSEKLRKVLSEVYKNLSEDVHNHYSLIVSELVEKAKTISQEYEDIRQKNEVLEGKLSDRFSFTKNQLQLVSSLQKSQELLRKRMEELSCRKPECCEKLRVELQEKFFVVSHLVKELDGYIYKNQNNIPNGKYNPQILMNFTQQIKKNLQVLQSKGKTHDPVSDGVSQTKPKAIQHHQCSSSDVPKLAIKDSVVNNGTVCNKPLKKILKPPKKYKTKVEKQLVTPLNTLKPTKLCFSEQPKSDAEISHLHRQIEEGWSETSFAALPEYPESALQIVEEALLSPELDEHKKSFLTEMLKCLKSQQK